MQVTWYLPVSLILLVLLLLFSRSWYSLSPQQFVGCSESRPWCGSWNKNSSILGIQNPKPAHHSAEASHHPLDPLTTEEINKVRIIFSSYGPLSSSFPAIHSLSLDEPDQSQVLGWKKGDPLPPRKASVIALLHAQTHLLLVDLDSSQVSSHSVHSGSGYPTLTMEDISVAVQVPLSDPEFNKSIMARGVELSHLTCIPPPAGWFGHDEEGRRVIKVQCSSSQGTPNFYMRPIEGLIVTVDLDRKEVVKISDKGRGIPVPKGANTDYRYASQDRPPEMC